MSRERSSASRPSFARPQPPELRPANRLLAALPEPEYRRLVADLKIVPTRHRQVLQYAREPIQSVYFPTGGVFSLMTELPDGTMIEAATVGDEGMFSLEAFFHDEPLAAANAVMQVPDGSVAQMGIRAFRRELAARGGLNELVGCYAQVAVAQIMQAAACNALHPIQQRCARWLLLTQDRVHRNEFRLSHESLAMTLGVQRPTVTVVAGVLQHAGLIAYTHGRITVLNRQGLEAASCSCYQVIREQLDRLPKSGLKL